MMICILMYLHIEVCYLIQEFISCNEARLSLKLNAEFKKRPNK